MLRGPSLPRGRRCLLDGGLRKKGDAFEGRHRPRALLKSASKSSRVHNRIEFILQHSPKLFCFGQGLVPNAAVNLTAAGRRRSLLLHSAVAAQSRARHWSIVMASDIFAKIGDIKGESVDDKHRD